MLRILVGLCVAGLSMAVWAAEDLTQIKAEIEKNIPELQIEKISSSPLPGLYEVTTNGRSLYISKDGRYILQGELQSRKVGTGPLPGMQQVTIGNQISYMTPDGQHAIQGDLYDRVNGVNITEQARSKMNMNLLAKFDDSKTIVFSPKNPKYTVTVFTDTSCGYCRKLHQNVPELNNLGVKVRYMLFPRAGPDSPDGKVLQSVWCARNQREAMNKAKSGGQVPEKTCSNPIAEHMILAQKLGLQGTPHMVTGNGTVIAGYLEPADLLTRLEQENKKAN
jgi:thiol:disulfide interchange protein DsbC